MKFRCCKGRVFSPFDFPFLLLNSDRSYVALIKPLSRFSSLFPLDDVVNCVGQQVAVKLPLFTLSADSQREAPVL